MGEQEFTVSETDVIVEYQNRLASANHENVLLTARVRRLEGELARRRETPTTQGQEK